MMSRTAMVVMLVAIIVLSVSGAWAQYGTVNLPSAVPWQEDGTEVTAQVRLWDGGNETYDINLRGSLGEASEVQIGWFSMSIEGDDPINDAVRASDLDLMTLSLLVTLPDTPWAMAVRVGAEFPTDVPRGVNTATGGVAAQRRAIPVISLPMQWGVADDVLVIVEPKGVGFDADMAASDGSGIVEGFGDLFMLGAGVRYTAGAIDLFADAAYPISGDNSVDENTNAVEKELAWSAGGSYFVGGSHDWTVDVFATNTAGPSPATSAIATPDQSIGVGVGVGGTF